MQFLEFFKTKSVKDEDDRDDNDDDSDDIDIDWVWGCGDLMRPSLTALSHTLTFWPADQNDEDYADDADAENVYSKNFRVALPGRLSRE